MASDAPAAAAGTVPIGDLRVNRLGYGALRITGPGMLGVTADRAQALAVLRRAVAQGVNFIDTADSYGPNTSEELIAEALSPYLPDLLIATKGGFLRPGPDRWEPDGRPEHLRAALDGSLQRLRLERVDLYQLHTPDPKVPFAESIGALAELREAGKIRHIGVSNVSVAQLAQARRIAPVATVQNRYNIGDRSSDDVLAACEREGIAFIPWHPLQRGGTPRSLASIARRHGVAPQQVALAWLLARSPVMLPIPGTAKLAHLDENLAAASLRLNSQEIREINAA
jgi:aryl-alcohol dehydrogenase-like predicted oxidoreductase